MPSGTNYASAYSLPGMGGCIFYRRPPPSLPTSWAGHLPLAPLGYASQSPEFDNKKFEYGFQTFIVGFAHLRSPALDLPSKSCAHRGAHSLAPPARAGVPRAQVPGSVTPGMCRHGAMRHSAREGVSSSLAERRSVSIAGLDCQIQAKTKQKLAGNCQIWQSDKA